MRKIIMNDRGMALILVILMVSIITAVTLLLNKASRSQIDEAANLRDGIETACLSKSGFCIGEALLSEDDTDFDSLNESWARSEQLSSYSAELFDAGHIGLRIEDETGKIPVNALVNGTEYNEKIKNLFILFLNLPEFDLTEQQAGEIVDAIKDWIDEDDVTTGFGAENMYYEGLENPYPCKNAPLDCIEELLMIRGITVDLYYGTDNTPGIANYVTLYGKGIININTASNTILKALSDEITDEMAADMDEFRRDEGNDLSSPSWYKNVPGMTGITIDPGLITTKSNTFRITSTGYLNDMSKKVCGVIERDSGTVTRLTWKVD